MTATSTAASHEHVRVLPQEAPQRQTALVAGVGRWLNETAGSPWSGSSCKSVVDAALELGGNPTEGKAGRAARAPHGPAAHRWSETAAPGHQAVPPARNGCLASSACARTSA